MGRILKAIGQIFVVICVVVLIMFGNAYAEPIDLYRGFVDAPMGKWYANDATLGYVLDKGFMKGVGNRSFGTNNYVTRAQVVTVLWRMAGSPNVQAAPFPDVNYGSYYGKAVNWVRSNGVINGSVVNGSTLFNPTGFISRQQLATMMARYAENAARINVYSDGRSLSEMNDSNQVSGFARNSVSWLLDKGIITGSAGSVLPQGLATRAQFAKIIAGLDKITAGKGVIPSDSSRSTSYSCAYFSFSVPPSWRGRWSVVEHQNWRADAVVSVVPIDYQCTIYKDGVPLALVGHRHMSFSSLDHVAWTSCAGVGGDGQVYFKSSPDITPADRTAILNSIAAV